MSNIKKKIKIRQGHRAYLTKILGNANAIVENYDVSLEKKLKQIRITLNERLDTLKTLDEEILELIEADEESIYRDRRCSKISGECSRNDRKYRQRA